MRKKWISFVISSGFMLLAPILFMTVVLIPLALVTWWLCAIVAVWDLRKVLMHEHATIIAEKMAQVLHQQTSTPPRS